MADFIVSTMFGFFTGVGAGNYTVFMMAWMDLPEDEREEFRLQHRNYMTAYGLVVVVMVMYLLIHLIIAFVTLVRLL